MKILIVKLSSLGDVVHAMPAVQDVRAARPEVEIDWVIESGFAPLARRVAGVRRVIETDVRRWRRAPLAAATRAAWRAFRSELGRERYDAVLDLQGLTKSALVARLARLAPGGRHYALANRTDGAGYEAPTRWLADRAVPVPAHTGAVLRSRLLCAQALGYAVPLQERFGLQAQAGSGQFAINSIANDGVAEKGAVVLAHGASRADKLWPVADWIALGQRLNAAGWPVALPHGSDAEEARGRDIAAALAQATVWPRLPLDALTDALAGCAGVVGVDSGLSHIAVALGLPHVQIYNHDTAWRTGPSGTPHQRSVYAQPAPDLETVWRTWQDVAGCGA